MKQKVLKQYCADKCREKGECKEAPRCDPYQQISKLLDELIAETKKEHKI